MTESTGRLIRYRTTSIVARNGKILLLREPQETKFQLPGGGILNGEAPESAAARELHEETGLVASKLEYLFDYCDFWAGEVRYWGQVQRVFRVNAIGDIRLSNEHSEFEWWDESMGLPLEDNVRPILGSVSGRE